MVGRIRSLKRIDGTNIDGRTAQYTMGVRGGKDKEVEDVASFFVCISNLSVSIYCTTLYFLSILTSAMELDIESG